MNSDQAQCISTRFMARTYQPWTVTTMKAFKFFATALRPWAILLPMLCLAEARSATAKENRSSEFLDSKRVVFLGDSNTNAGGFIVQIEAALLEEFGRAPEMINLGLSSETCCGLSEPNHPFPRPNVQERLDRVLKITKPDVVVSCYGMNDGIYHPMDEARFAAYRQGTKEIIAKVNASGAKLVLLTPPPFDPLPSRLKQTLVSKDASEFSWKTIYEHYDSEVIEKYAEWIMEQRDQVWAVVDIHAPMKAFLIDKRKSDPDYAFSNDGVHFNQVGHGVLALSVLDTLGFEIGLSENEELIKFVKQRQSIMHPAWLSEVGHLRPGVAAGLPIEQARAEALKVRLQSPPTR
jgi:lysophospholipase L1-like esterase